MGQCTLAPAGSNYTFLTRLELDGQRCRVVYKPREGEAPLWDFPDGTLYRREYAAYLLSLALGWEFVPPTVIRDGAHGVGSVQLFIQPEPGSNYFSVRQTHTADVRRMAVFDFLANNADRKAGHCFLGTDGHVWGIDHGLTFHHLPKLRTVIWDFAGEPIPEPLLRDVAKLCETLARPGSDLERDLRGLLAPEEVEALAKRMEEALATPRFPVPRGYRDVPWPWV